MNIILPAFCTLCTPVVFVHFFLDQQYQFLRMLPDGRSPYLYKNGMNIPLTVLNKTTVRLPCLLNYPLENVEHKELQLFKAMLNL